MVFSDTGAYVGKAARSQEGQLTIVRPEGEETYPLSRFILFPSEATISTEPMTLVLMPIWFEQTLEFAAQLSHYESKILPLLIMLADQKISEATFLMLQKRHFRSEGQEHLQKATFFTDVLEGALAKIKVAIETLEATKLLGERNEQEFLLKNSLLTQIRSYLELVVDEIERTTVTTSECFGKMQEMLKAGSLSSTVVSEASRVMKPFCRSEKGT